MTEPVVEWLTATLDEIERVAQAAARDGANNVYSSSPSETAKWEASQEGVVSPHGVTLAVGPWGVLTDEAGAHIALHDPRSVLARVEAERAVVTQYAAWACIRGDGVEATTQAFRHAVANIAYGHRYDREGFDPAWAPEGVAADA